MMNNNIRRVLNIIKESRKIQILTCSGLVVSVGLGVGLYTTLNNNEKANDKKQDIVNSENLVSSENEVQEKPNNMEIVGENNINDNNDSTTSDNIINNTTSNESSSKGESVGSTNKPNNGTSTNKPNNGTSTSKPNNGTSTSKPNNGTSTSTSTSKPNNGTSTNKPNNGTSTNKPNNGTNIPNGYNAEMTNYVNSLILNRYNGVKTSYFDSILDDMVKGKKSTSQVKSMLKGYQWEEGSPTQLGEVARVTAQVYKAKNKDDIGLPIIRDSFRYWKAKVHYNNGEYTVAILGIAMYDIELPSN